MITLKLAQDYIPYPSETQYIGFMRVNHLDMFLKLLDQSQFNRRARSLGWLSSSDGTGLCARAGISIRSFCWTPNQCQPWDTNAAKKSDFSGSADYGRCVSRNLKYFGYKLVAVCTLCGIPVVYELVPANTDERLAAETVIDYFSFCDFFGDKGFLGWK